MSATADDIDAALQARAAQGSSAPSSGDDIEDALQARASGKSVATTAEEPKRKTLYDPSKPAIGDSVEQMGHQMLSGAYHSVVGGYKGLTKLVTGDGLDAASQAVQDEQAKAYQAPPSTLRSVMASPYNPINYPQEAGDWAANKNAELGGSPGLSAALTAAPTALMAGAGVVGPRMLRGAAPDTQELLNQAASRQSMGAASSAADISSASPELQAGIGKAAQKTQGNVNSAALQRKLEADSLPVKMQLTEGQATQNPATISEEQNTRAQTGLDQHYNRQNQQLADNLRNIRETAGPDVFSTNKVEHGETLIDAYKQKAAAADAEISAKYQALKDANGGQFPVDARKLTDNATTALHDQLLYDHAPKAVMSTLGRLADNGNMTFENYEALRTNLARIQRSSQDGNERAAAGVIRNAMEELPLAPGAAKLKPLADQARQAAASQFKALRDDPAYDAAVNDKVTPDQFVNKYITGSSPSASKTQVAKMRANLADDDRATQTMGVAALDHLRDQAKIDVMGNGNFAAANFNKHLDNLRPKLGSLLPPEQANQLDTLGNVARYTTAQPKGSYVNNSNTLVGSLGEHSKDLAEALIPGGKYLRKAAEAVSNKRSAARSLDPAAGLDKPN